jgi:hypothetical protein
MLDPLIQRSIVALEENRRLLEERRNLLKKQQAALYELRWAIYETGAVRTEIRARRENSE